MKLSELWQSVKNFVTKYPLVTFALIGLLVYGMSLFNGFVWDDEEQLLNNTLVHSLSNIGQLLSNSTFSTGGAAKLGGVYYRPVMMIYFAVLHTVFGPSGFVFHFVQVIMHILSVWLLYKVVTSLTNNRVGIASALLFLVHPINVEAVVYVSAVQDVLVALFGLLSLWLLVTRKSVAWVVITLFIAFLAKENAVVFLFIEIVYLTLFMKGSTPHKEKMEEKEQQDNRNTMYAVYIVIAVCAYVFLRFGLANVHFQKFEFAPIVQLSFIQRTLHIPALFVHYLYITVWPVQLAIAQHWVIKEFTFGTFIVPLFVSGIVFLVLLIGSIKIGKTFFFFSVWFVLALGMYMQLFPFDFTVAERWFYIGLMGLISLMGLMGDYFKLFRKPIVIVLYCCIVILLAGRTVVRSVDWRNELALFGKDIRVSKDSFDLTNNYGVALFRVGKYAEAKEYFTRSVELAPSWTINLSNLGATYQRAKDFKNAKKYYLLSIKYGDYYLAYENYAGILITEKKNAEAKKFLESEALPKFPYNENLQRMYQYLLSLKP
ncbi:MAG: glycosyltransferase family 39 protein [Patescibacteria group bacterium]|jgi:tetratricopeptide (TPR) repeat protein